MLKFRIVITILIVMFVMSLTVAQEDNETLTVVTYDSFAISEEVLEIFEANTGIEVEFLRLADAGVMLNQSILSINNPLGDMIYGVDNTLLTRAFNEDLFIPYEADGLDVIPEEFKLDDEMRVTPVAFGDVCLNYDVTYFEQNDLQVPTSLIDLTLPEYDGLLVVQDPATSSPGLAFLLTTIATFGEDGDYSYIEFWQELLDNDVAIVNGWTEAYYGEFSAGSEDGDRPLVVSYASSPPVEVLFGDPDIEQAPTGAIVADDMCFRQIEFAGILDGAENVQAAELFIDFLISIDFQEDLPLQMFVFPVNPQAELPEIFVEHAQVPENPVQMSIDEIDENREDWIRNWTRTILR